MISTSCSPASSFPAADKFQALFADAGERSQELVAKSQKATEELTDLAKANVEAFVEAGRIAAAGAKSIGQDVVASGRDGFEQASDAVKTLAEAKSPTEFFQLQCGTGPRVVRPLRRRKLEADRAASSSSPAKRSSRSRTAPASMPSASTLSLPDPLPSYVRQPCWRPSPSTGRPPFFMSGQVAARRLAAASARCHILGRT